VIAEPILCLIGRNHIFQQQQLVHAVTHFGLVMNQAGAPFCRTYMMKSERKLSLFFAKNMLAFKSTNTVEILYITFWSFHSNKNVLLLHVCLIFMMMTTLSYPTNTAKSSFHYYESFPSIFKPTQPLIPDFLNSFPVQPAAPCDQSLFHRFLNW